MSEALLCLDTGVWIKFLVPEEPQQLSIAAVQLVRHALDTARLIAPAFAWAEVGSVLRKKVRQDLLEIEQAETLWIRFGQLPVEFIDTSSLRASAWRIAKQYSLARLYDAAFLACVETASFPETTGEFWTADQDLLRSLGRNRPSYVRELEPGQRD